MFLGDRDDNNLLFFSLPLGYFSIPLFFLQYGFLYPGGTWPGSPLLNGGSLGNHSPQCFHADPASAFFLEDCPPESRLAVQGGPFSVSKCRCVWSSQNEPKDFPCDLLVLLLRCLYLVCLFKLISYLFPSSLYCFSSGIQTLPHNAKVHYNYANFLKDNGRHQEAIHHYTTALRSDSTSVCVFPEVQGVQKTAKHRGLYLLLYNSSKCKSWAIAKRV